MFHLFSEVIPLTKGLLGPHQAESEGYASWLLFKHLGHLVVSTAYNALVVDGLDVVTNAYCLQLVYGAAFLYPLKETSSNISHYVLRFPVWKLR